MYDIDEHIRKLRDKGEDWSVTQLELIRAEIDKGYGFQIGPTTLGRLDAMIRDQRVKRDEFERFTLDFQREWSTLEIIRSVRDIVEMELEEKNEKFV
jgi:hypothetical protein